MPDRPDPVTDRLARFTPAAGLDRDALMFEAGRRSARGSLLWKGLAGLFATTQVITLLAFWPRPQPAGTFVAPPPAVSPVAPSAFPPASPDPGLWSVGSRPDVVESYVPAPAGEFVSAGPPLTAGSALRFD